MYYTTEKKITVKNKKVELNILHECSKVLNGKTEYKGTPGKLNEPVEYYENGKRISNEELVKKGLAEDNTGTYYNEKGESVYLKDINRKPYPHWRKDKPEEWEMFDGKKWIVNKQLEESITKKREKQEKKNKLNAQLSESLNILTSTDYEILKLAEKIIEESNKDTEIIKQRQQARKDINKIKKQIEEIK